mgnify:CR=1 FL=1
MKRLVLLFASLVLSCSLLSGCGYNELQSMDESVNAAWSEVINQYQRRTDLIPNVVNSVKGEADFEKSTLTQVINARAKAGDALYFGRLFKLRKDRNRKLKLDKRHL